MYQHTKIKQRFIFTVGKNLGYKLKRFTRSFWSSGHKIDIT